MQSNGFEIYNSFQEELFSHWKELYACGGEYNLSLNWCKTWWEVFGNNKIINIYTFWENKKLKLLAPFYIKSNRLYLIGTKPDIYDEFNVLYEQPKYLDKLVDYLASCKYELGFKHLNSNSELAKKLVNKFADTGIPTISQVTETKPRIIAKINQESAIKSDIKRNEKNLLKNLNEEYVLEFSPEKKEEFVQEFFSFHKDRWNGGMLVKKKNFEKFIREIYFKDENLFLSRLFLNNSKETAAHALGYIDSNNIYWYSMTAVNPKYKKFSPGKVLLYKLIQELKEKNITTFDFGRGSENYKREFADSQDVLFNFFTYKTKRKYMKTRNFIDKVLKLVYGAR